MIWKQKLILYGCEALGLGVFMFSAGVFDILIDHPDLWIRQHLHSSLIRRFFIGLSMGLTTLGIIFSPFGKLSGAYINPSVTIVRYRLGEINLMDCVSYSISQFVGGAMGMCLMVLFLPNLVAHPAINYIVTIPPRNGEFLAFILEFLISFLLISTVLFTEKSKIWRKYTPFCVATLITLYITFEVPYSGMSMNPARTFASAIVANQWNSFWIYCTAPVLGMLLGEWITQYYPTQKVKF